jgi:hypothetical protein
MEKSEREEGAGQGNGKGAVARERWNKKMEKSERVRGKRSGGYGDGKMGWVRGIGRWGGGEC